MMGWLRLPWLLSRDCFATGSKFLPVALALPMIQALTFAILLGPLPQAVHAQSQHVPQSTLETAPPPTPQFNKGRRKRGMPDKGHVAKDPQKLSVEGQKDLIDVMKPKPN